MTDPETYEVFALRYASRDARSHHHFIGGDPHNKPMPMDYFVWVVRSPERVFVIDTGFGEAEAKERDRKLLHRPASLLKKLDIDAAKVEDVIVTHLHYDHAGTLDDFPKARFHLQDSEIAFATGRQMCWEIFRHAYSVEDIVGMVRRVHAGRVQFHEGDSEIAPGVSLHHIGGHTRGMQVVRVRTARGWVVLASDASHFYANMEEIRPFPIVDHVGAMVEGYATLRRLADSPKHIIPGHDPLVTERYPAHHEDLSQEILRLDLPPKD
jgi:glyoxylase-like metal-dependent hydrolase (beta-lactamase superfamily II)